MSSKKVCQGIPEKYYSELNEQDKIKQCNHIKKSRKQYKTKKYSNLSSRPKLKSYKKKESKHVVDFKKLYEIDLGDLNKIQKKTGVPIEASEKVLKKGRGAFSSSGSRPGQTAESWARARLASFILGRGAYRADYHIWCEYNIDKKIKVPKNKYSKLSEFSKKKKVKKSKKNKGKENRKII